MSQALGAVAVQAAATRTVAGAGAVLLVIYAVVVVVGIIAAVKVLTKAGYSGWWVLITLVPVVNFVMLLVFAFSEWPVLREVKALRAQTSGWTGYGPPGYGSPGAGGGTAGYGQRPYAPSSDLPGDRTPQWPPAAPPSEGEPATEQQPGTGTGAETGPPRFGAARAGADYGAQQGAQAPPGWYPTPDGRTRYWDGEGWTDHFS